MKTSELKSLIRSLIKEELTTEARVINYKNGVTASVGATSITLSHPKYGNQTFKQHTNSGRYKTDKGEYRILDLVNKFADGTLGKGDKPYKKIEKTASEPKAASEPKSQGKYKTLKYTNGVTAKVYDSSINLSHSKHGSKTFKQHSNSGRYKTDKGEYRFLDLIKKFAAGELTK